VVDPGPGTTDAQHQLAAVRLRNGRFLTPEADRASGACAGGRTDQSRTHRQPRGPNWMAHGPDPVLALEGLLGGAPALDGWPTTWEGSTCLPRGLAPRFIASAIHRPAETERVREVEGGQGGHFAGSREFSRARWARGTASRLRPGRGRAHVSGKKPAGHGWDGWRRRPPGHGAQGPAQRRFSRARAGSVSRPLDGTVNSPAGRRRRRG